MPLLSLVFVAFAVVVAWKVLSRRLHVVLLSSVVLISLITRLISSVYVDLAGPVYSVQLFRFIGPGTSATVLAAAQIAFLVPFLWVFRAKTMRGLASRSAGALADRPAGLEAWIAPLYFAFAFGLYFDMLRRGVVPVLVGMERWVYTEQYGGPLHRLLVEYRVLVGFLAGAAFSIHWLRTGRPNKRILLAMTAVLVYLLLAGHRVSAFVSISTAFLLPFSLCINDPHLRERLRGRGGITTQRRFVAIAGVLLVLMVSAGLYRSYSFTRAYGALGAWEAFEHRVMVQQSEMWWATYERVFMNGTLDSGTAARRVFLDPITDPRRNSTIPYLMVAEIGSAAYPTLDRGLNYGGGFPEIAFELLGPLLGFVGVAAMGTTLALLLLGVLRLLARGWIFSAFAVFYVTLPFLIFPFGGMLNFLVNWKFWLKVTLALFVIAGSTLARRSRAQPFAAQVA